MKFSWKAYTLRKAHGGEEVLAVFNFTPVPRDNYRVGVSRAGLWREALNSDATVYGGSGWGNMGGLESSPVPYHGRFHSLNLQLPPLAAVFLRAPALVHEVEGLWGAAQAQPGAVPDASTDRKE